MEINLELDSVKVYDVDPNGPFPHGTTAQRATLAKIIREYRTIIKGWHEVLDWDPSSAPTQRALSNAISILDGIVWAGYSLGICRSPLLPRQMKGRKL